MKKGFTLIELLVVIAIVAVLAAAVVLTLNPAELLRQARDATRLSDLAAIRSAMALYLVDPSPTYGLGAGANCYVELTAAPGMTAGCDPDGAVATYTPRFTGGVVTVSASPIQDIDGTGWIPVNFAGIPTGSPVSALPSDPAVSMATDLFYAYKPGPGACTTTGCTTFEINATMESTKYAAEEGGDGGNDANRYEVGNEPGLDL